MTLRGPTAALLFALAVFHSHQTFAQRLGAGDGESGVERPENAEEVSSPSPEDATETPQGGDELDSRTTIVRDVRPQGGGRPRSAGLDLESSVDGQSLRWWPWVASFSIGTLGLALDTVTETPVPRWTSVGRVDLGITERLLLGPEGRATAGRISDVLLISTVLATYLDAALWRHDDLSNSRTSYRLLMMDTLVFSMNTALLALIKGTVRRERPSGRFCVDDPEFGGCENRSVNRSFYSGHASTAFTAASLMCAHQRLRGQSALGRTECVGGLAVATSVAMLRIVAGKHYMSDVLVGATMGFLLGYIFPVYVFPRRLPVLPGSSAASESQRTWW